MIRSNRDPLIDKIYDIIDEHLKYHVSLMLNYADRNPVEELHEKHLGDPVFEKFGLTDISFAQKRWAAGFANSCATNLGRFTDKAAKAILTSAFEVPASVILKKIEMHSNNHTEIEETDGVVLIDEIPPKYRDRVSQVVKDLECQLVHPFSARGVGFELRGRYGKNDDTLIQKDEHMAAAMRDLGAVPVLATFSITNAAAAIKRLKRSWVVTSGNETIELIARLTTFDLGQYLDDRQYILKPVVDMIKSPPSSDLELHKKVDALEKKASQAGLFD